MKSKIILASLALLMALANAKNNATNLSENSSLASENGANLSVDLNTSEQNATNLSKNANLHANSNASTNLSSESNATSANSNANLAFNPQGFWQTNKDNAYEVLKHEQGIYTRDAIGSDASARAFVRGFELKSVYMDGIEFSDFYMGNDLRFVGVFGDTELYKGFLPSGFSGLGGALNITSAKPQNEFEAKIGFKNLYNNVGLDGVQTQKYLSVGTKSGRYFVNVDYADTERENFGFSKAYTNSYEGIRRVSANGALENRFVKLGVGFWARENDEYALHYINQKGNKGELIEDNTLNVASSVPNSTPNVPNYAVYDSQMLYALGKTEFNDKFSLDTKLFYQVFNRQMIMVNGFSLVQKTNSNVDDFRGESYGANVALNYDIAELSKLKFGIRLKDEIQSNSKGGTGATTARVEVFRANELKSSVFTEFMQGFGDFRIVLGASYDRADILKAKSVDLDAELTKNTNGHGYTAYNVVGESGEKISPKGDFSLQGALYYDFTQARSAHLAVGRKLNFPTLYQRYGALPFMVSTANTNRTDNYRYKFAGNANLKPESIIYYEMGYKLNLEQTHFNATIFFDDLNNMFVNESTASGAQKLINAYRGFMYGGEVGVEQGFFADNAFVVGVNYAYLYKKARGKDDDNVLDRKITEYPNHIANAKVAIKPVSSFELVGLFSYKSAPYLVASEKLSYIKGTAYMAFDMIANLYIGKGFSANAGVYNLTDRDNSVYDYTNAGALREYHFAGRRYFIGFEYKYQK